MAKYDDDTQGGCIFDVIDAIGPRMVILENVRSIFRTGPEQVKAILARFEERGYEVTWRSLNAADFSLPQQRHRAYFVARRGCGADAPPLAVPEPPPAPRRVLGDIMETRA